MKRFPLLATLLALAAAACAPERDLGLGASPGDGSIAAADGLPCDVAEVLTKNCLSCHGGSAASGGGNLLGTYADLMTPSRVDPSQTFAQRALVRMKSATNSMPPGMHLAQADIDAVANWVEAGAKRGSCEPVAPDAGTPPVDVADGGVIDGLPCAVADELTKNCLSCHGGTGAAGGGHPFGTYAELAMPSTANPAQTNAQRAVIRMQDAVSPMPPGQHLPQADIDVLASWVAAGIPQGTCGASAPDAGFPDSPPVCTSNRYWTSGDRGSASMHPGLACIDCHDRRGDGPQGWGGTVFPTNHEPDNCNGDTTRVLIELLDSSGRVVSQATSNGVGNFSSEDFIGVPVRARLTAGGRTREMLGVQTSTDCNGCHTQGGLQGAPGRIVAP